MLSFLLSMTYLARVRGTFPNAGGTYAEHVVLIAMVILLLVAKGWQMLRK